MAHYAQINEDNVVVRVSVLEDIYELDDFGELDLNKAERRLQKIHGEDTRWRKTSYSASWGGKFAGIGDTWNEELGKWIPPRPFPSWSLNTDTLQWDPPVKRPESSGNITFDWDEDLQNWIREEQ